MKPRRFEQSLQSAHPASLSIRARRGGKAEYHKPAGRTEARLALRERFSSNRIHRHFDSVRREFAHRLDDVALRVIDRMVHANLSQIFLFRGTGCSECHQAASLGQLDRGNSHTSGGCVHQHSSPGCRFPITNIE